LIPICQPNVAALIQRLRCVSSTPLGAPVEPDENRYAKQFGAIRGLRLTVTDVRAKFKFGGNRTQQHRDVIAKNLGDRGSPLDREARAFTTTRGVKKS